MRPLYVEIFLFSDFILLRDEVLSINCLRSQGKAVDADQLTDDEWRISSRKALKGFTRLDAKYFIPFFTRKFTRQVSRCHSVHFLVCVCV